MVCRWQGTAAAAAAVAAAAAAAAASCGQKKIFWRRQQQQARMDLDVSRGIRCCTSRSQHQPMRSRCDSVALACTFPIAKSGAACDTAGLRGTYLLLCTYQGRLSPYTQRPPGRGVVILSRDDPVAVQVKGGEKPFLTREAVVSGIPGILRSVKYVEGGRGRHAILISGDKAIPVLVNEVEAGVELGLVNTAIAVSIYNVKGR